MWSVAMEIMIEKKIHYLLIPNYVGTNDQVNMTKRLSLLRFSSFTDTVEQILSD